MVKYLQVREKIQQVFCREINPQGVYRNIKGCIFKANLEGQG